MVFVCSVFIHLMKALSHNQRLLLALHQKSTNTVAFLSSDLFESYQ